LKNIILQFFTYNLVGIVNTLFGFTIVFFLMFFGLSPTISNFIGYFFGAILSYNLNKKFTFKNKENSAKQALKFFMVLAISYLLNFFTLQLLLNNINPYMAQLISGIVYTLSSFVLAKLFVFKD